MWPRADRRRGFSLMEMMIAVTISTLILGTLAVSFVLTARSVLVTTDQTRRQSEAAAALDRVTELLRNAVYPVTIVSTSEVQFTDIRNPGATARIWLSGEQIMYDPDTGAVGDERELASPVAALAIRPDTNPLIGASALTVEISYNYQSFRDYHPDASRNATFVTSVFMRNTG